MVTLNNNANGGMVGMGPLEVGIDITNGSKNWFCTKLMIKNRMNQIHFQHVPVGGGWSKPNDHCER